MRNGGAAIGFMLLVSFAWWPKIRKLQLDLKKSNDDKCEKQSELHGPARITAISSFARLFCTPFVAALYGYLFELNVKWKGLHAGFLNLRRKEYLTLLLINIACGWISQFLAKLGCRLGLKNFCFLVPVILSTILSIVFVGAFNGCKLLNICRCGTKMSSDEVVETVILAFFMCFAQILSTIIYVWQSQEFIMAKDSMLFWVDSYDGMLLTFVAEKQAHSWKTCPGAAKAGCVP